MSRGSPPIADSAWTDALDRVLNDRALVDELDTVGVEPEQVASRLEQVQTAVLEEVVSSIDAVSAAKLPLRRRRLMYLLWLALLPLALGLAVVPFLHVLGSRPTEAESILFGALAAASSGLSWVQLSLARRGLQLSREEVGQATQVLADRLDKDIRARARAIANELGDVPFNEIRLRRARGLSEIIAPALEVSTRAKEELTRLLGNMESASIGISGTRGAGKSTLIAAACDGRLLDGPEPRGVRVPAPMRYASVEFIPYLFNRLCLEIAPPGRQPRAFIYAQMTRISGGIILGCAIVAIGVLVIDGNIPASLERLTYGLPILALGALGIATSLSKYARWRQRVPEGEISRARAELHALRYRDTLVRGSSSETGPEGLKFTRKREISSSEQPPTLPDLVARYREFVRDISKERKVIIGIDELDKMQPEEAQELLNDVKVLFGEPNCFYLVSMSEDAMSSFERRGMPIRDVFDSSFDAVLRVEALTAKETQLLLRQRVVGIGAGGLMLCHALAGGLPRELIRCARVIRDATGEGTEMCLDDVTRVLVQERMALLERATAQAAAKRMAPDTSQPVVEWLRDLPVVDQQDGLSARWEIGSLLDTVEDASLSPEDLISQRQMVLELATAAYHADAVWGFFVGLDHEKLEDAMRECDGQLSAIELIARGQADMTVSPRVAWSTIDRFRELVGLDVAEFPYVGSCSPR